MLELYPHAAEELAWRFLRADALLGMHGQVVEGGRSGGAFDAASCERMHDARMKLDYRNFLAKRDAIDATLGRVTHEHRATIERAFVPFGRASAMLAACFTVGRLVMVQVGLHTQAAYDAFTSATGEAPGDGWSLLQWMEQVARTQGRTDADAARLRGKKFTGHVFERILNESSVTTKAALEEYDERRVERVRAKERAKADFLRDELAATHVRIWGAA